MHIMSKIATVATTAAVAATIAIAPAGAAHADHRNTIQPLGRLVPTSTTAIPPLQPFHRLRIGCQQAHGRSLNRIHRQQGFAPPVARDLSRQMKRRVYPGAKWRTDQPLHGAVCYFKLPRR